MILKCFLGSALQLSRLVRYILVALLVSLVIGCKPGNPKKCYSAADLGEGNEITVTADAGDSIDPSTGKIGNGNCDCNTQTCQFAKLSDTCPRNKQIAKWTPTTMYTNGFTTRRGILKIYISGFWLPWSVNATSDIKECFTCTLEGKCRAGLDETRSALLKNIDMSKILNNNVLQYDSQEYNISPLESKKDAFFIYYGQNYDYVPCKISDGSGLYGLIAIRQEDGSVADPNMIDFVSNHHYPANLFRVFHMRMSDSLAEAKDPDGYFFELNASESCGDGTDASLCVKDKDPNNIERVIQGQLYFRILDDHYEDNSGVYTLRPVSGIYQPGGLIENLVNAFKKTITVAQEKLTNSINQDLSLISLIRVMLLLYVAWSAFGFLIGMTKFNQSELITRAIKIGFIITLISPSSYEFFNFYLYSLFTEGTVELASIINNEIWSNASNVDIIEQQLPANTTTPFVAFDYFFRLFFSEVIHCKIAALLFTWQFFLIPLFYIAFVMILITALQCVVMYIVAITYTALLLVIAPLFISFILFETTKGFFEGWLQQMISNSLMCIIATAAFALLGSMLLSAIDDVFHYRVCWDYIQMGKWKLKFSFFGWEGGVLFWTLSDKSYQVSLEAAIQLILLASLAQAFVGQIPSMVDTLSENQFQPLGRAFNASWSGFAQQAANARAMTIGLASVPLSNLFNTASEQSKLGSLKRAPLNIPIIGQLLKVAGTIKDNISPTNQSFSAQKIARTRNDIANEDNTVAREERVKKMDEENLSWDNLFNGKTKDELTEDEKKKLDIIKPD